MMKKLLLALVLVAGLMVPATALAGVDKTFDWCSNIEGTQWKVPHGYVVRIDLTDGSLYCVPKTN